MRGSIFFVVAALALPAGAAAQVCPTGCISAKPPDCATRVARAKAAHCDLCQGCDLAQAYQDGFAEARRTNAKNCPQGMGPAECAKQNDHFYQAGLAAGRMESAHLPCGPVPCETPKEKVRPLFGLGLDYDVHNLEPNVPRWGWHAFGGAQFPKDRYGHNSQIQAGLSTHHGLELVPPPAATNHGHGGGGNPTAVDPTVVAVSVSYVVVF